MVFSFLIKICSFIIVQVQGGDSYFEHRSLSQNPPDVSGAVHPGCCFAHSILVRGQHVIDSIQFHFLQ